MEWRQTRAKPIDCEDKGHRQRPGYSAEAAAAAAAPDQYDLGRKWFFVCSASPSPRNGLRVFGQEEACATAPIETVSLLSGPMMMCCSSLNADGFEADGVVLLC